MQVTGNSEEIKRSWTKAAAVKQEISLEAKQRTVFILVETSMSFELISKKTVPEDLFRSLDKFVADHGDSADES
jgi:hypothetical protein